MKIAYSRHAELRVSIREIGENEVAEVLSNPVNVYYDIVTDTLISVGKRTGRKDHWLIVVYKKKNDTYRIVTVIDTKNIDRIVEKKTISGRWIPVW
ncbi:MAG: DUF4258 domain-containing protein [Desulfurococcales archaeon]|nr:DUF4258 domain-containing protein [Desulfurococcales archaeon]